MFDGDFDPAAHDKIMEKLAEADFNDDEKPVFDEMDFTGFDFSDDELQKKSKKERKRGKRAKKGELEEGVRFLPYNKLIHKTKKYHRN